jgi:hypothetical protein
MEFDSERKARPEMIQKKKKARFGCPNLAVEILYELIAIATAASAATAEFTATTTTTTAAGTLFTGLGNVNGQFTSIDALAIKSRDSRLGFFGGAHGDETKTTGTAADAVHHQVGFGNGAKRGKCILKVVFCGIEGKISNKQFIITHVL